jgi:hypothetical protein
MYLGIPGRQTPWLIASRGVFSFFSTARPGFVGLDGAIAIVVDEGAETAEGAIVADVVLCMLDRCGEERTSMCVVQSSLIWAKEEMCRSVSWLRLPLDMVYQSSVVAAHLVFRLGHRFLFAKHDWPIVSRRRSGSYRYPPHLIRMKLPHRVEMPLLARVTLNLLRHWYGQFKLYKYTVLFKKGHQPLRAIISPPLSGTHNNLNTPVHFDSCL